MIVDVILQAGIALSVGAWLALENDGPAIRQDQPVPNQQHALLPKLHIVVVLPDEARALRYEQDPAGRAVRGGR